MERTISVNENDCHPTRARPMSQQTLREGGDVVGGGWCRSVTRWRCGRLVAVERLVAGAATEGATSAGRSATDTLSYHVLHISKSFKSLFPPLLERL